MSNQKTLMKPTPVKDHKILDKEDSMEMVKFAIQKRFVDLIGAICRLDGGIPIQSWIRSAVISQVEASLDDVSGLGMILRDNLKRRYRLSEEQEVGGRVS